MEQLGPILPGKQLPPPSRNEIKDFYNRANPLEPFWINSAKRRAIADAFAETIGRCRYTCYACAIMWNHAHVCIRRHRDDAITMWDEFAQASREKLRLFEDVGPAHAVWSDRRYKVFIYDPPGVRGRIKYIEENPQKEGLESQMYPFTVPYDGFPYTGKRGG